MDYLLSDSTQNTKSFLIRTYLNCIADVAEGMREADFCKVIDDNNEIVLAINLKLDCIKYCDGKLWRYSQASEIEEELKGLVLQLIMKITLFKSKIRYLELVEVDVPVLKEA